MFEYVDTKFLVLDAVLIALLLFVAILESGHNQSKGLDERGGRIFAALFTLVIIGSTLYMEISTKESVQESIVTYKKGLALECGVGFNSYLVQKSTGWELSRKNFLKDDLLIPIKNCRSAL